MLLLRSFYDAFQSCYFRFVDISKHAKTLLENIYVIKISRNLLLKNCILSQLSERGNHIFLQTFIQVVRIARSLYFSTSINKIVSMSNVWLNLKAHHCTGVSKVICTKQIFIKESGQNRREIQNYRVTFWNVIFNVNSESSLMAKFTANKQIASDYFKWPSFLRKISKGNVKICNESVLYCLFINS